jgi:hypothetical protein
LLRPSEEMIRANREVVAKAAEVICEVFTLRARIVELEKFVDSCRRLNSTISDPHTRSIGLGDICQGYEIKNSQRR